MNPDMALTKEFMGVLLLVMALPAAIGMIFALLFLKEKPKDEQAASVKNSQNNFTKTHTGETDNEN